MIIAGRAREALASGARVQGSYPVQLGLRFSEKARGPSK